MTVTIVNGQVLANLVILNRASEKAKSALLIEGDKDGRIYRKVVDPRWCRAIAAGNRAIAYYSHTRCGGNTIPVYGIKERAH